MNKLVTITLAFLIILAALGYYFYFQKTEKIEETMINEYPVQSDAQASLGMAKSLEASSEGIEALRTSGKSYLNPQGLFSFLYPKDYIQDLQGEKIVRIYKKGPTQKGQTEMYDGVILTLEPITIDKDLNSWVEDYIHNQTQDGTSQLVEEKSELSINNYPGYTFKLRGLGESEYYVLQKDTASKNALVITMMVADPTKQGFQEEVNNIISTIQLLK